MEKTLKDAQKIIDEIIKRSLKLVLFFNHPIRFIKQKYTLYRLKDLKVMQR